MTHISTLAVHGGTTPPLANHPVNQPIYQAAAWEFQTLAQAEAIFEGRIDGATYGTSGVPNQRALEQLLAHLEGAEEAIATSGGMSALAATFLTLLKPGDRVLASRDLFGRTAALLGDLGRWGVETVYLDGTDLEALRTGLESPTRLLMLETISNPRLRVPNIPAAVELAHQRGSLVVVDNTFASPYHCRPRDHGVDVVIESVTKSLAGHHDVVLGAVAGAGALVRPIRETVGRMGMAAAPFIAWLGTRGAATLALRQERAARNAAALAEWLVGQPGIHAVHYPGLPEHPDHQVARRILGRGFGSVVAFELPPDRAATERFLSGLERIRLVHSLGGPRTTLSHSVTMTHRLVSPAVRQSLGIHEGFFRLAVGIEDYEDIVEDLARGIEALTR